MIFLFIAVFLVSSLLMSFKFVHMLQLASYQTPGYKRWFSEKGDEVFKAMIPLAFGALTGLWQSVFAFVTAMISMILTAVLLLNTRKKTKKPLKITARVVRLFIILTVILSVFCAGGYYYRETPRIAIAVLSIGVFLLPWLVPLANIISLPLQRLINNGYIRDAQKKLRAVPDIVVIGITGSYGKTSAKLFLQKLLSVRYNTLATPESYNTPMGVVRTIRENLTPSTEVFICEMGARHVGDIKEICDIVKPRHGLLTAVGPMHLETFFTQENITNTKFELINALPEDGIAVLANYNDYIKAYPLKRDALRYGTDVNDDFIVSGIRASSRGSEFKVTVRGGESFEYTTPVLGRHQIMNIAGALALANKMGIALEKLSGAVMTLESPPHRQKLISGGEMTFIDDAFNANPAGAEAALETLSMFEGTKIIITPGMVELGELQEKANYELGKNISGICDYAALVGEKQTHSLAEGLRENEFKNFRVFESFNEALEWVKALEAPDKIVLLENDLPDNY